MTRDELEACASRVLEDVEISNRRGQRILDFVQEFKRRFITEIMMEQLRQENE